MKPQQLATKSQKTVIYKYQFKNTMVLPAEAQILSVQYQYGVLQMWCIVPVIDPVLDQPTITRRFEVIGTGHHFFWTPNLRYITTVQEVEGSLIWHIFEEVQA